MKHKRRAFTLSELLLAVAIIVVVLCALLLTLVTCFLLDEANRNRSIAMTHAQFVLEDIRDAAFTTVRDSGDTQWDWGTTTIESNGLTSLDNESVDVEVSGTELLDVTVTVNWQDRGQRDRSVTVETKIVKP